jgi:hypothetical protein
MTQAPAPALQRWGPIALILLLAFGLRLSLALNSPHAHDEDNYLSGARTFYELRQAGRLDLYPEVRNNPEHPQLAKIIYSFTLYEGDIQQIPTEDKLFKGSNLPLPERSLHQARLSSVIFSTLAVLALSLVNPLAGLALTGQSIHYYYGSLAYLDAFPTLMTALSAILYMQYIRGGRGGDKILWLSALCFGLGVTAKYPFALMGVALVAHALFYRLIPLPKIILWGLLAILIFFLYNPYLYPDPLGRVRWQLSFHEDYAENETRSLTRPITQLTYPQGILPLYLRDSGWANLAYVVDLSLFCLAVLGVYPLWREKSLYAWWLVLGMAFLMLWNTQWVQHKMMILVPYSFSAARGLQLLWDRRTYLDRFRRGGHAKAGT